MTDVDVGERLLLYRDARGWSQERTAEEAGVSPTTITHIETGQSPNPRRVTLMRLARAFGVSLEEFLSDRPPKGGGPSLPAQILRREAGHDHLSRPLSELVAAAEGMTIPEIKARIRELAEESRVLHEAVQRPREHLPPEALKTPTALRAARDEIRAVSRGLVARVISLAGVGVQQEEAAAEELRAEVERLLTEHSELEANASV